MAIEQAAAFPSPAQRRTAIPEWLPSKFGRFVVFTMNWSCHVGHAHGVPVHGRVGEAWDVFRSVQGLDGDAPKGITEHDLVSGQAVHGVEHGPASRSQFDHVHISGRSATGWSQVTQLEPPSQV